MNVLVWRCTQSSVITYLTQFCIIFTHISSKTKPTWNSICFFFHWFLSNFYSNLSKFSRMFSQILPDSRNTYSNAGEIEHEHEHDHTLLTQTRVKFTLNWVKIIYFKNGFSSRFGKIRKELFRMRVFAKERNLFRLSVLVIFTKVQRLSRIKTTVQMLPHYVLG